MIFSLRVVYEAPDFQAAQGVKQFMEDLFQQYGERILLDEPAVVGERIFVREGGRNVELTREEWNERHPDRAPVSTLPMTVETQQVYEGNITHNMTTMARECGLYDPLWCPEENGIETAAQLIEPIERGLQRMRAERERLQEFNPENGWGSYDVFLGFVEEYLAACKAWPNAKVRVWK